MDFSSILYAAIGGGGGAAIGSLLSSLVEKKRKGNELEGEGETRTTVRTILTPLLTVVGIFGMGAMYKNMTLPRIIPLDDSELIAETPIYGVIKKQSPDEYKRLIFPIDKAVRNGIVEQDTLNEMRVVLYELIGQKTEKASADVLREAERLTQSQNKIYKEKSPHICTLMMNSEPFPSVEKLFSEKEVKLEQQIMVKLFTTPPRDKNFIANLENGKMTAEALVFSAINELGVKNLRPEINGSEEQRVKHQEICDLAILISEKTLSLEDNEFLNVKTYMESLN